MNQLMSNPVTVTGTLVLLSLIPFLVLGVTSFLKLSVVLGILKTAIGAGQVPSGAIVSLLAFALSLHIMAPVARECAFEFQKSVGEAVVLRDIFGDASGKKTSSFDWTEDSLKRIGKLVSDTGFPIKKFLFKHCRESELSFFESLSIKATDQLAQQDLKTKSILSQPKPIETYSFDQLIPAFILSELREAFAIGFSIFLPFLIVDLVVANILMGLGMMMVSPATISLPIKLILFVACDGWLLLSRGLVLGYS